MKKKDYNLQFRTATRADVPHMVQMLSNDPLGRKRENYTEPLPDEYYAAFAAIDQDVNNQLIIGYHEEKIIGFFQLTFIPYLTYRGGWRALVEGVRVHETYRNQGIGKELLLHAIALSREKGCHLIQLTTDKKRPAAIAFYESLGFTASHEGMKLHF